MRHEVRGHEVRGNEMSLVYGMGLEVEVWSYEVWEWMEACSMKYGAIYIPGHDIEYPKHWPKG